MRLNYHENLADKIVFLALNHEDVIVCESCDKLVTNLYLEDLLLRATQTSDYGWMISVKRDENVLYSAAIEYEEDDKKHARVLYTQYVSGRWEETIIDKAIKLR